MYSGSLVPTQSGPWTARVFNPRRMEIARPLDPPTLRVCSLQVAAPDSHSLRRSRASSGRPSVRPSCLTTRKRHQGHGHVKTTGMWMGPR